jgi:4-hydroxy-tetrahydrodipicolinate synthase
MTQLGRVLTAMATPFDATGTKVDFAQAKRLAKALLDSGTDGIVVAGTTGESPTLSHDEKLELFKTVLEVTRPVGAHVIAGTTDNNTAKSIDLSQEAQALGVDAILGTVPSYNNPPQEGLYQHFKAIAGAVKLPVLLYNVPARTSRNMEASTTLRLGRDVENIIGIKEASGNFKQIGDIIAGAPKDFQVWSGNDSDTLTILALGGYGIVSVASHLTGSQIAEMIKLFLAGDHAKAAEIHHRLVPLVDALFVSPSPIPLKYALNKIGMETGPCRLPLVAIDDKAKNQMDGVLATIKVDLPVGAAV